MILKLSKFREPFLTVALIALFSASCGPGEDVDNTKKGDTLDPNKGSIITINGELFSIPSPIQTALMIKQSGSNYTKDILNPTSKSTSYSTNFQKALNLGIYGADLGYVTIYDQTQDAVSYLNAVRKLADELGITGAFDKNLLDRFQKNLGVQDSLLGLVSVAYRASDAYLKNNERNDVSGLVLAGGWIESLNFATGVYKMKPNDDVKRRIAEQKSSLTSLIKLLTPYYSQPEYTELIDNLKDLQTVFDGVEFKYSYEKPTVEPEKQLTTVNSKSEVKISEEQINSITEKIRNIRNQIVG